MTYSIGALERLLSVTKQEDPVDWLDSIHPTDHG